MIFFKLAGLDRLTLTTLKLDEKTTMSCVFKKAVYGSKSTKAISPGHHICGSLKEAVAITKTREFEKGVIYIDKNLTDKKDLALLDAKIKVNKSLKSFDDSPVATKDSSNTELLEQIETLKTEKEDVLSQVDTLTQENKDLTDELNVLKAASAPVVEGNKPTETAPKVEEKKVEDSKLTEEQIASLKGMDIDAIGNFPKAKSIGKIYGIVETSVEDYKTKLKELKATLA